MSVVWVKVDYIDKIFYKVYIDHKNNKFSRSINYADGLIIFSVIILYSIFIKDRHRNNYESSREENRVDYYFASFPLSLSVFIVLGIVRIKLNGYSLDLQYEKVQNEPLDSVC